MAEVWVQDEIENSVWTSQPERPGRHPAVESKSSRVQGRCQAWKELYFEIISLRTDFRARDGMELRGADTEIRTQDRALSLFLVMPIHAFGAL